MDTMYEYSVLKQCIYLCFNGWNNPCMNRVTQCFGWVYQHSIFIDISMQAMMLVAITLKNRINGLIKNNYNYQIKDHWLVEMKFFIR